jgi:hypothetical protein
MKTKVLISLFAGFTALTTVSGAEKQKSSAIADYPFWMSPKRGSVGQFVPGLTAALQLTASQRIKSQRPAIEMVQG